MNFLQLLKRPSAFLPLAMSCAALSAVLIHLHWFGIAHEQDEGAAAHVFQLLILAQVPLALLFAIRFVPRAPKGALAMIALQAGAAAIAMLPVWWFRL